MAYLMRKTPRSSFMRGMGAAGGAGVIESPPILLPTTQSPPIYAPPTPPTVAVTPTTTPDTGRPLTTYLLWGGAAYLAYWFLSKE